MGRLPMVPMAPLLLPNLVVVQTEPWPKRSWLTRLLQMLAGFLGGGLFVVFGGEEGL